MAPGSFLKYFYEHDSFRLNNLAIIYCIGRALNTFPGVFASPSTNRHSQHFSDSVSFFNSDDSFINLLAFSTFA